jgi:hypothetical protein
MPGQHGALISEDLLQHLDSFDLGLGSDDRTVVDAAHAQRVDVFVLAVLRHAIIPVLADTLRVSRVIVVLRLIGPFSHVVAEHRLSVRRTHHDRIIISD